VENFEDKRGGGYFGVSAIAYRLLAKIIYYLYDLEFSRIRKGVFVLTVTR